MPDLAYHLFVNHLHNNVSPLYAKFQSNQLRFCHHFIQPTPSLLIRIVDFRLVCFTVVVLQRQNFPEPYIGYKEKNIYDERSETFHLVVQRSCGCPSVEVFTVRLDRAQSNLFQWNVSLSMAGGVELNDLTPSNLNHSVIL